MCVSACSVVYIVITAVGLRAVAELLLNILVCYDSSSLVIKDSVYEAKAKAKEAE